MKNTSAESPRVPVHGSSAQGQPAPKARTKVVVDGNQVNIPGPLGGDEGRKLSLLIWIEGAAKNFQEIAPRPRPYPKPTLVDW